MKARRVKGLDPEAPFGEAIERVLAVCSSEVRSFARAALDPAEVKALHDMRIAAKRLRYAYEIAEPCLGRRARDGAKRARGLQDLLGEIHDCDVLLPEVRRHRKRLRAADVAALRDAELDPASRPNRSRHRGVAALEAWLMARRDVLYARFVEEWPTIRERL